MASEIPTERLLAQLQKLTARLSEIVARDFLPLSQEQLNWKEMPSQWSIAECIEHLNKIATTHFDTIAQTIKNTPYKKSNIRFEQNWLGKRLIARVQLNSNNYISKPRQSSTQYAPTATPYNTKSVELLLVHFNQILDFIKSSKSIDIQNTKIPVAFLGLVKLPLGDILQMIVYHFERHIVQAQRMLYSDGFPENQVVRG